MFRRTTVICATMVSLMLTGCSTMTGGGSKKDMTFTSTPAGATVIGDHGELGKTPLIVAVSPGDTGHFIFEKEGYETGRVQLKKIVNPKSRGNIGFLPLYEVGVMVDQMTNSYDKFETDKVDIALKALGAEAA